MKITRVLLLAGLSLAQVLTARAASSASPEVQFETSLGNIRLKLNAARAPITVKNFLTYVKEGHYDGVIFHRVIPGFMIQGGGFDANMKERSTRAPIKNEHDNGLTNRRGTISMARTSDPNSATAQFFINVANNAALDQGDGYAVFGEVTEGMDVVDKIVAAPTTSVGPYQNVPRTPIFITKAKVVGGEAGPAPAARPAAKPDAAKPAAAPSPVARPAAADPKE